MTRSSQTTRRDGLWGKTANSSRLMLIWWAFNLLAVAVVIAYAARDCLLV